MTINNVLEEKLTYPLDYYFPNMFYSSFTDEERVIAAEAYKIYTKDCYKQNIAINPKNKVYKAQKAILEEDRKSNYFETVRVLFNVLLSKTKTIEELYLAFFPDRDSQVSYFQQQILDAIYLFQHQNEIDKEMMELSWGDFYEKNTHKMETFVNKINWYPNYWDFNEKNKLFDYWRYRYFKNLINFSPSKKHVFGGMGFFEPSYLSIGLEGVNENVSVEIDKIRKEYLNRKKYLLQEQKHSQAEDCFRLQILMAAEEAGFNYWLAKKVYPVIEHGDGKILKESLSIIDTKERVYKLWLGILIEYDRTFFSPLSYPDRNISISPLNITESHYWLTRNGREIQSSEDSSIFLKYKSNIKRYEKLTDRTQTFLPVLLTNRHEKAIEFEKKYNIKRSSNGEYKDEEKGKVYFGRPATLNNKLESFINERESIEEQVKNIIETTLGIEKIDVLAAEAMALNKTTSSQEENEQIPKENPYLILHENLFSIFVVGDEDKKKKVFGELLEYIEKHRKQNERFSKPNGKMTSLFFFMDKKEKVREKIYVNEQSKPIFFNLPKSDLIYEQDYILINGKDLKSEGFEDLKEGHSDEFDDKTRFDSKFLGVLGRALNVQAVAKTLLKQSEHIVEFSEKIKSVIDRKIISKVVLGLETVQQRMEVKQQMKERYSKDSFVEVKNDRTVEFKPR